MVDGFFMTFSVSVKFNKFSDMAYCPISSLKRKSGVGKI
jgi:hypothetical protein